MAHVDTAQSTCRLGLVRCDITPPPGIYHRMWGAASHERATGVHRPLTATAVVFQSQDCADQQVLVAVDHCLLWTREMAALLDGICSTCPVRKDQVAVAFSHTHAAGLMGLERVHLPGGDLIPVYLDRLTEQVALIVNRACQSLQPVVIQYAYGHCRMAAHRDYWDAAGRQFVCGFNPEGPVENTVLVARVTAADSQTLATVVNYACHPTSLAWQNTLISPDFPGAMREVVEGATNAPCIFLQGASGDLGPREGFVGDPAVADRNGRQLGYAALSLLEGLPPPGARFEYQGPLVSGAMIGTWVHVPLELAIRQQKSRWRSRRWTVPLPFRPDLLTRAQIESEFSRWHAEEQSALKRGDDARAAEAHAMVERMTRWRTRVTSLPEGTTFHLPVCLWQMGDAVWVAVEGEHYHALQRKLRERFAGVPIVVATLANGARCTYLPTADAYGRGIYQDSIAVLAPGSLEELIDAIGNQLGDWLRPSNSNLQ
jgi:hypothetical protein